MTVVNLRTFWQSLGDDGEIELSGLLEATPWAGRGPYTETLGEKLVVGGRTRIEINESSPEQTLELKPTENKFSWKLVLTFKNPAKEIVRYVAIPNVESIVWSDLVDVDPITYEPSLVTVKAWEEAIEAAKKSLEEKIDDLSEDVTTGDAASVVSANTYTDTKISEIDFPDTGVPESSIDEKDQMIFAGSKEYTDEAIAPIMEELLRISEMLDHPLFNTVSLSGDRTLEVLNGKTYEFVGTGNVTLTGETGLIATLIIPSTMAVSNTLLPAGMFVAMNRPEIGWRFYGTSTPIASDPIAPTPGALNVTLLETNGLLRVTNASDDVSLHETPYRFSTNGGTTWSAWQAESSYILSSLSSGTSYSFRHQVRDSSYNLVSGTVVNQTTAVAPTWTTRMVDSFTASDGTVMPGRTPDVGTVWGATPTGAGSVIRGNKVTGTGLNNIPTSALWPNGSGITQRVRVSFDYALPISPPYGATLNPHQGINSANNNYFFISLTQNNAGVKSISMSMYGGGSTWSAVPITTSIPESGTFTFDYSPTRRVGVVQVGSTVLGYFSGGTDLPWFGLNMTLTNNATMDNLKIEVSST